MSDISLTPAQRASLLTLTRNDRLSNRGQSRLETGQSPSNIADSATDSFRANPLNNQAQSLLNNRDEIANAINLLNTSLQATQGVDRLVNQLGEIANTAAAGSIAERRQSNNQFTNVVQQIGVLIDDATVNGINLLNDENSQLNVQLGEQENSRLQVQGVNLNRSTVDSNQLDNQLFSVQAFGEDNPRGVLNNFGVEGDSFTSLGTLEENAGVLEGIQSILTNATERLRGQAQNLGSNLSILNTRLEFANNVSNTNIANSNLANLGVNTENNSPNDFSGAQLSDEAANLLALQTRQQLGTQGVNILGEQQRSLFALLGQN